MTANTDSVEERLNLKQFVKENASIMFGLDRRIIATVKHLLFRPGSLTQAFSKGDTESFTSPTTLYFTINLLFFLFLPLVNSGDIKLFAFSYEGFTKSEGLVKEWVLSDLEQSGLSEVIYQTQFDSFIKYNQPALIFVIIPFLVLILRLINLRNRTTLLSHTVYAFHFMSFFLVTFLLLGVAVNLMVLVAQYFPSESVMLYLITIPLILYGVWVFLYLFSSHKLVHGSPIAISLLKSLALLVAFIGLMFIYTRLLVVLSIVSVN